MQGRIQKMLTKLEVNCDGKVDTCIIRIATGEVVEFPKLGHYISIKVLACDNSSTRLCSKSHFFGTRVGAILGSNTDSVEFLGYGTYQGEAIPEEAVGDFAKQLCDARVANPKILLDSGKVVYGCECWCGPEKDIKERLATYKRVIIVDIDDVRSKLRTEQKII